MMIKVRLISAWESGFFVRVQGIGGRGQGKERLYFYYYNRPDSEYVNVMQANIDNMNRIKGQIQGEDFNKDFQGKNLDKVIDSVRGFLKVKGIPEKYRI